MAFDEVNLQPLYKLIIGKPGSSYTFSIAERIGLEPRLIQRARTLVDEDHFRLDKLLNRDRTGPPPARTARERAAQAAQGK